MGLGTEHFTERELACPCCGINRMVTPFMAKVEAMRSVFGKPLTVSRAYSCSKHNMEVSKTGPNGPHTTGHAIDIVISGEDDYALLDIALTIGFNGIGINQKGPMDKRFLHFDDLQNSPTVPRPRIWSY